MEAVFLWCPERESNPHHWFRRPVLYPLSYRDKRLFLRYRIRTSWSIQGGLVLLLSGVYTKNIIKNFRRMNEMTLKQIKTGALVLLALAALGYTYQYGRQVNQTFPTRTFTVEGSADVETPNDIATFTATVLTEGEGDVAALQGQNTEKMNALIAYLKENGVEKKDLKTENYSVNPRYDTPNCLPGTPCPAPGISGYSLSQSLQIKVRNVDTLGPLLSGVVEKGANSVSGVSFVTDDSEEAKDAARKEAFSEARERAENIARAGDFRLGKLVSFYENGGSERPMYDQAVGIGGAEALKSSVSPVIEPGMSEGKLQVVLTFEIAD